MSVPRLIDVLAADLEGLDLKRGIWCSIGSWSCYCQRWPTGSLRVADPNPMAGTTLGARPPTSESPQTHCAS